MSKKKPKKRNFKYGQGPLGSVRPRPATEVSSGTATPLAPSNHFSYVAADVRRIGLLALGFVCLQLGLWYLINYTALGDKIYSLIRL